MREERTVWVETRPYTVLLSDEKEALLAAQAAGRAVVGIRNRWTGWEGMSCTYLAETWEGLDEAYLEKVVRRHLGLPWRIAQTARLDIREFSEEDAARIPQEDGDTDADRIFYTPERLKEYIRCQYGFYGYGIWALQDRQSGELIGKAGITAACWEDAGAEKAGCAPFAPSRELRLELGYHIFEPYRRAGYATEACLGILAAVEKGFAELYPAGDNAAVRASEMAEDLPDAAGKTGEMAEDLPGAAVRASEVAENLPGAAEKAGGPAEDPPDGPAARCTIYAKTDASNEASVRLLETCGFRFMTETCTAAGKYIRQYEKSLRG